MSSVMIDSSSSASWTSPGAGITRGYNGRSNTLRTFIVFMAGLAMVSRPTNNDGPAENGADASHIQYNACELIVIIFLTFSHFRGMYFDSLAKVEECTPYRRDVAKITSATRPRGSETSLGRPKNSKSLACALLVAHAPRYVNSIPGEPHASDNAKPPLALQNAFNHSRT